MPFQDLAPAQLTECFYASEKCHLYRPAWYNADEHSKVKKKTHKNKVLSLSSACFLLLTMPDVPGFENDL